MGLRGSVAEALVRQPLPGHGDRGGYGADNFQTMLPGGHEYWARGVATFVATVLDVGHLAKALLVRKQPICRQLLVSRRADSNRGPLHYEGRTGCPREYR